MYGQPVIDNSQFGVIFPGKPVMTEWMFIDGQYMTLDVEDAVSCNEFTFFLLKPLAGNLCAAIHYSYKNSNEWTLLGAVSNERPSAIFNASWNIRKNANSNTVSLRVTPEPLENFTTLANARGILTRDQQASWGFHLAKDLYNYVASFSEVTRNGEQMIISQSILNRWFERFKSKYEKDPNFVFGSSD